MPLIQLHHEQRNRLGNNSRWSIKAALEAGNGGVGRLTEGAHTPARSLTPTETEKTRCARARPRLFLQRKANNHCFRVQSGLLWSSRGAVTLRWHALGSVLSVQKWAISKILRKISSVGIFSPRLGESQSFKTKYTLWKVLHTVGHVTLVTTLLYVVSEPGFVLLGHPLLKMFKTL